MKRQLFALAIAFVGGTMLGLYLSRPAKVRAGIGEILYVSKLDTKNAGMQITNGGAGGRPLGFSCVPNQTGGADCYVLTTFGN